VRHNKVEDGTAFVKTLQAAFTDRLALVRGIFYVSAGIQLSVVLSHFHDSKWYAISLSGAEGTALPGPGFG
jgi:hypothetical protein